MKEVQLATKLVSIRLCVFRNMFDRASLISVRKYVQKNERRKTNVATGFTKNLDDTDFQSTAWNYPPKSAFIYIRKKDISNHLEHISQDIRRGRL